MAERFYGRIQMERVLATANALGEVQGPAITPGMLIEIPSLTFRRVEQGETWESLAALLLGDEKRSILLAQVNGHKPWIQPELGQLIRIPYNLTWRATGEESLATLAYRFLGSTKHAYRIVQYNQLGEDGPKRGQVLLLPLSDLTLTEEGSRAARRAAERLTEQAQGSAFESQAEADQVLLDLALDVQGGRYVSAVARGAALLESDSLSRGQEAKIHRMLLEAYVALDIPGRARTACSQYRDLDPETALDPVMTSPKILAACPPQENPTKEPAPSSESTSSDSTAEKDDPDR